jgi:multiple sugar transport system ATP-binding protein
MNLIPGVAAPGGVAAHGCVLPHPGAAGLAPGQAVVYGIRPEHLDLADDGLPARVAVVEPTGAETMVYFRAEASEVVAIFRDRHPLAPGQPVHLRPRADKAHLFDPTSGARL